VLDRQRCCSATAEEVDQLLSARGGVAAASRGFRERKAGRPRVDAPAIFPAHRPLHDEQGDEDEDEPDEDPQRDAQQRPHAVNRTKPMAPANTITLVIAALSSYPPSRLYASRVCLHESRALLCSLQIFQWQRDLRSPLWHRSRVGGAPHSPERCRSQ
jgi:hypothetical protein